MRKTGVIVLSMIVLACTAGKSINEAKPSKPKEKIITNISGKGSKILLKFFKGPSFNYPVVAVWLEDLEGKYIQTLYVSKSITTKVFTHIIKDGNKWIVAPARATKSLPYWAHKKNPSTTEDIYKLDDKQVVPDAYSGATPKTGFVLKTRADNSLPEKFKIMMEINQKWDRNEYWTSNKYPGDEFYKLSCQPAVVYEAIIEASSPKNFYPMNIIGHSHYSGLTNELFTDVSTLSTALTIADSVLVMIKGN